VDFSVVELEKRKGLEEVSEQGLEQELESWEEVSERGLGLVRRLELRQPYLRWVLLDLLGG
jgi:hypothetical protein